MADLWEDVFERNEHRPPRPLLVSALKFVRQKGEALDLGAGGLADCAYLLEQGFGKVTAVDKDPVSPEVAARLPRDRFLYVITSFDAFAFPLDRYDLVSAQFSLSFNAPDVVRQTLIRVLHALRPGGVFCGQMLGERDDWRGTPGMAFYSRAEAEALLSRFEMLEFGEEEHDTQTARGTTKHWHVHHLIARKK